MRKKDFLKRLSEKCPHLPDETVKRMNDKIVGALVDTLKTGGRAEIRGFGTFFSKLRKPRLLRSPHTGQMMEIPEKSVPRFKAGKELTKKVDYRK